MKRVVMIHGWSGGTGDHWFPWLKDELEKKGYQVFVPEMSDTDAPVIADCVNDIKEVVGEPD